MMEQMVHSRLLSAMLFVGLAHGQPLVEFSAKIGVPVSDTFQTGSYDFLATGLDDGNSATRRYTFGVGVLLRMPRSFGAEVDVLYKRLGYDLTTSAPSIPVVSQHTWTTANSWEFPLLGVYRLPRVWHIASRISAGPSFRTVNGETSTGQCVPLATQYSSLCSTTAPIRQANDWHLNARSSFGGTFGAGIETRLGPIRLTPEIRYTRWRADAAEGGPLFDLRSNPNQIDFLLGIGF